MYGKKYFQRLWNALLAKTYTEKTIILIRPESESEFQPRFVFELYSIYIIYIQNPFSNIFKIQGNPVSVYHNEIWIVYPWSHVQLFC